jgi:Protein of unknown function (DUF1203)
MTTTLVFQIEAIPTDVVDGVRAADRDVSGNPVEHVVATGGEPLRCCLRDAREGEQLTLFGFAPDIPASPYREIGPVFAHAEACGGPASTSDYPAAWRGRPQALRAYDARGWIHSSTRIHDGHGVEDLIAEMLDDPEVVQVHSRNIAYGCYMFKVRRAEA